MVRWGSSGLAITTYLMPPDNPGSNGMLYLIMTLPLSRPTNGKGEREPKTSCKTSIRRVGPVLQLFND